MAVVQRALMVAGLAAWTTACASTPVRLTPHPFPRSGPSRASGLPIAQDALALVGSAYRFGGVAPETGFDCSGLTLFVMARHGVALPRTVIDQFRSGTDISRGALEPGDLVFFSTLGPGATHVGIVTDPAAREFVHAPADGSRVRVDSLDAAYWRDRWIGARRIITQ